MRIRIGHGLDGAVVHVDTADCALILLVGDPGHGKTTLSRHLARWWCADPQRTARAFVEHPHQYRDLPIEVHALTEATTAPPATPSHELTIIDGADHLDEGTLRRHTQTRGPSILTSSGEAGRALQDHAGQCLGLLRRDLVCSPYARPVAHPAGSTAYDPAQGRLDWPPEVVAVIPDTLGAPDLPPHRWQVGSLPAIEASG